MWLAVLCTEPYALQASTAVKTVHSRRLSEIYRYGPTGPLPKTRQGSQFLEVMTDHHNKLIKLITAPKKGDTTVAWVFFEHYLANYSISYKGHGNKALNWCRVFLWQYVALSGRVISIPLRNTHKLTSCRNNLILPWLRDYTTMCPNNKQIATLTSYYYHTTTAYCVVGPPMYRLSARRLRKLHADCPLSH